MVKEENMAKSVNASRWNALPFPSSSLYFPALPCCFEVWKTHPTFAGRNVRWSAKQKEITNKTIIRKWDILSLRIQIGQSWGTKYSTLPRPATRHSGNEAGTPIGCTTVMCAGCLISASLPEAENQQAHLAALPWYGCVALCPNRA